MPVNPLVNITRNDIPNLLPTPPQGAYSAPNAVNPLVKITRNDQQAPLQMPTGPNPLVGISRNDNNSGFAPTPATLLGLDQSIALNRQQNPGGPTIDPAVARQMLLERQRQRELEQQQSGLNIQS